MKHPLLVAVLVLCPLSAHAQANAENLVKGCRSALSNDPDDTMNIGICEGTLNAVGAYLQKMHAYFEVRFPNLHYPIHDRTIFGAYLATTVLLGPDDCFPASTTIKSLAEVLVRYGNDHSDRIVGDSFPFAVKALDETYRCRPGHQ